MARIWQRRRRGRRGGGWPPPCGRPPPAGGGGGRGSFGPHIPHEQLGQLPASGRSSRRPISLCSRHGVFLSDKRWINSQLNFWSRLNSCPVWLSGEKVHASQWVS